jgi:putative DNA methylase
MAVVVKGQSQLIYLPPDPISEMAAAVPEPEDAPETALPEKALGFRVYRYGFSRYKDLFTPRQLTLLTALGPLVEEAGQMAEEDAIKAGWLDDGKGLAEGGDGAKAYGEAIVVYLSFIVDKIALYHSSLCSWHSSREILGNTFAKRSVPMIWNYAEGNPFSDSSGSLGTIAKWLAESLRNLPAAAPAEVSLRDAQTSLGRKNLLVSTDPPYYDNIGYADLSDFFYVWLRRPLKKVYKSVFARVVTPKSEEIVASPFRFQGDRKKARVFFEAEMSKALRNLRDCADDGFPLTIYYAFKQRESQGPARKPAASPAEGGPWALGEGKLLASTGWEAMLSSIVDSGFAITGTWPILTEKSNRPLSLGVNALSSSIVLVCRKRPSSAPAASLQDFVKALRAELAPALSNLTQANISPVDLAQAAIGPGMAVYSRYSKILEPDGEALTVRRALALINQALDAHFAELEGALDVDSGLCLAVFSEAGFDQLSFGKADVLARAKNSSVARLVAESVLEAQKGQVRLYRPEEIKAPARPGEKNAWRLTHLFLEALRTGGVEACARVALAVGVSPGLDRVKALAYRLYGLCESENWAQLALPYNSLVYAWPEIQAKAILLKDRPPTLEEPRLF